mmetsp:Transcript_6884/g.6510  ORF Transcript_6884/g.6510 Transcript_6884/m.6510 type:complete len:269 (-) Transcript_6884:65-871(-)
MTVEFISCTFRKNTMMSVVVNAFGEAIFDQCIFTENLVYTGVLSALFEGALFIDKSCFVGNQVNRTGTIFIQAGSVLVEDENFGEHNLNENGDCTDVFYEFQPTSCILYDICEGSCSNFHNMQCFTTLDFELPYVFPTTSSPTVVVTINNETSKKTTPNINVNSTIDEVPDNNSDDITKSQSQSKSFSSSKVFLVSIFSFVAVLVIGITAFFIFRFRKMKNLPGQNEVGDDNLHIGGFHGIFDFLRKRRPNSNDSGSTLQGYDDYDEV